MEGRGCEVLTDKKGLVIYEEMSANTIVLQYMKMIVSVHCVQYTPKAGS